MKKALSLILALCLLLSVIPASAMDAVDATTAESPVTEPVDNTTVTDEAVLPTEPAFSQEDADSEAFSSGAQNAVNNISSSTEYATTSDGGSLNYTSTEVYEGNQITLEVTGISGTVSWRTSNSTLATVENGVVTGKKAGVVKITATVPNYTPLQCTVYVVKAGGTYSISTGGMYLGIEGIQENTPAKMVTQYSEGPRQLRQLWKIKHLGYGYYSVRPLYKLDMALHASDGTVDITSVDSPATVPLENKWRIYYGSSGYEFRYVGSLDECMRPATGSSSGVVTGTFSEDVAGYQWTMTKVTGIEDQMLLINKEAGLPATNAVRYIATNQTRTLNNINLAASFVSMTTNTQSITWTSSNTAAVTVNASTGTVTGVLEGQSTITASRVYEGVTYSASFTVKVLPIPNGEYYIRNPQYGRYLQIDDGDASNNYATSGATMEQWAYNGGNHQKWKLTSLGDGYYSIISVKSGLALSVPSGKTGTADVSLVQEAYSGLDRQKWKITLTDDYYYKIKPKSSEGSSSDLVMSVGHFQGSDPAGVNIEQRAYASDSDDRDVWELCSRIDFGMSTDNYSGNDDNERQSYLYANTFYNGLTSLPGIPTTKIHHYNLDSTHTASKTDFSVNGAISNSIDFMIYMGHGHDVHTGDEAGDNDRMENHIQYSHATTGAVNVGPVCSKPYAQAYKDTFCLYTDEVNFGSSSSDLRWVWMYTCNFLTPNDYVTNSSLKELMTGAHILMGYSSTATLCNPMSSLFAQQLRSGVPIIDAFFYAGRNGEAYDAETDRIQKVLFIPQTRYETIYSPHIRYNYDSDDVRIMIHEFDGLK